MQSPKFRSTFAYIKSNEEIINYIYKSSEFTKICRSIAGKKVDHKDLKQDCLELIIRKQYDLVPIYQNGGLNYFFAAIALKTFRSNAFNTVYRINDAKFDLTWVEQLNDNDQNSKKELNEDKPHRYLSYTNKAIYEYLYTEIQDEKIKREEAQTHIIGKIENPQYTTDYELYEGKLIEMYYRSASCAEISRLTGIPERTVYLDVKRLKERLKSEYDKIVNS